MVWDLEFWSLGFVCYLVLGIWNFVACRMMFALTFANNFGKETKGGPWAMDLCCVLNFYMPAWVSPVG